ncbi:flagellar transcriptional regulator FlhC [Pseudidiomarina tainanensis]|jgi:flagellar transcriptional activator FlhC|uniref:Flagellar transcriptional regulator FlhC n=1 Tax=Pseudidiomarina tainanensis TaxID=502365 RepID=A0ACD2HH32_9GAMM|nr:flagellar transcriptional regulator FlhC [Pseudidiomarina tainanensis]RZQ55835.1 flagellar transcriptional regulator FlhC [Pseudidiomarina tainanensis]
MTAKKLLEELNQVQLAIELIELGARLQVLESEVSLNRGRLVRLYKEVSGKSPPKGMLPFSTDWFMTWQPNVHSSFFYNIYSRLREGQKLERMQAFIKAYKLYQEHIQLSDEEEVLALTRAWTLIRFFESDMFQLSKCTCCGLQFVNHAHTPDADYVCGVCQPPSRAGKPLKQKVAKLRKDI